MKLLILPSHRLMLHTANSCLTLLPDYLKAEDLCLLTTANLVATLHYKTVAIYSMDSILQLATAIKLGQSMPKILPIVEECMPKKISVLDLYQSKKSGETQNECIFSDRFGDLYKLPLVASHTAIYLNSNLGIPNFIRHIKSGNKEYLLLSDEENRIKIYNSANAHELVSFWLMINQSSIECEVLTSSKEGENPLVVMLMRYENKSNLEIDVRLFQFVGTPANIEADQFPATEVSSSVKFGKDCLFYTMISYGAGKVETSSVIVFFLYHNKIVYELFTLGNEIATGIKSKSVGEILIEEGKWDYLHAMDTEQGSILIAYGSDVEMPLDIELQEGKNLDISGKQGKSINLNKYEKILKVDLHI